MWRASEGVETEMYFCLLYAFFWVILRHLNFICQHFRTLCLFRLHTYPPVKIEQTECSGWHIKFRRRGITQKKAYQHSEHGKSLKSRILLFSLSRSFSKGIFQSHWKVLSRQDWFRSLSLYCLLWPALGQVSRK